MKKGVTMYKKGEVKAQQFIFDSIQEKFYGNEPNKDISLEEFLKKIHFVNSSGGPEVIVVFYTESNTKL